MALPKPWTGPAQPLDTIHPDDPRRSASPRAGAKPPPKAFPVICTHCGRTYQAKSPALYGKRCVACNYGVLVSQNSIEPKRAAKLSQRKLTQL